MNPVAKGQLSAGLALPSTFLRVLREGNRNLEVLDSVPEDGNWLCWVSGLLGLGVRQGSVPLRVMCVKSRVLQTVSRAGTCTGKKCHSCLRAGTCAASSPAGSPRPGHWLCPGWWCQAEHRARGNCWEVSFEGLVSGDAYFRTQFGCNPSDTRDLVLLEKAKKKKKVRINC